MLLGATEETLEVTGAWSLSKYNPLFSLAFSHFL
jgi:hypothetical protein